MPGEVMSWRIHAHTPCGCIRSHAYFGISMRRIRLYGNHHMLLGTGQKHARGDE